MEIFKYAPNWERIEQRRKLERGKETDEGNAINIESVEFHLKQGVTQKKTTELCTVCQKDRHLPSACPERPVRQAPETKQPLLYRVETLLSPTTVKVVNLPFTLQKHDIRELLRAHQVKYDGINMVHSKLNREEFKGIVYLELPTKEEAAKCVSALDGLRMDVQVVSAMVVEGRSRL